MHAIVIWHGKEFLKSCAQLCFWWISVLHPQLIVTLVMLDGMTQLVIIRGLSVFGCKTIHIQGKLNWSQELLDVSCWDITEKGMNKILIDKDVIFKKGQMSYLLESTQIEVDASSIDHVCLRVWHQKRESWHVCTSWWAKKSCHKFHLGWVTVICCTMHCPLLKKLSIMSPQLIKKQSEAMRNISGLRPLQEEIGSLYKNQTCVLLVLRPNYRKTVVGCKWIFKKR